MKHMIICTAAVLLSLAWLPGAGAAAEQGVPAEAYARVNAALLEHHLLPRYERLAEAAAGLAESAEAHCGGSGETGVAALRRLYGETMDAWMGVQHVRFGPVELFMRSFRLYFWPQARGKVAPAVDALLADGDREAMAAGALSEASVAVQGLPAVEYLLYTEGGLAEAADAGRCALLTGISANLLAMAQGIIADWRGGKIDFERLFLRPGPDNAYYDTHQSATLDLFKSFHGGLRRIADVKLGPVLGEASGAARPQLAESRASGRGMRNIVINLEALEAMYLGDGGQGLGALVAAHGGDAKLDPLMRKAFAQTLETARGIEGPLAKAVAGGPQRAALDKLLTEVLALKQIVKSRVAEALGLGVGFNALDGD